ncbi:hypothetical protein D3C80_1005830 [compost metagenome]
MGVFVQNDVKGCGLQRVAGQDGGGLVIGDVQGRTATTHVVVVHGRQIVMHQRIGVDAFQSAGGAQDGAFLDLQHPARLDGEEGTQTLAGAERGVAHRLGQARFGTVGARQQFVERDGDQIGDLSHAVDDGLFGGVGGQHGQNSLPPSGRSRSTPARTTWPAASGKPRVSTSDLTGPIWRGGKLTTAATLRSCRSSKV